MATGELRTLRLDEIREHNNAQTTWIIMNDLVYDVTKFILEHPGGEEVRRLIERILSAIAKLQVILNLAGQDATDAFDDVGHSSDARDMTNDYLVGKLHPDDHKNAKEHFESSISTNATWSDIIFSPTWTNCLIPIAISISVYVVFKVAQRLSHSRDF